jgi:hypothetical protein
MSNFERLRGMSREQVRAYLNTLSFEERMTLTHELAQTFNAQVLKACDIVQQKAEDLLHPNYEEIAKSEIERIRRM